MSARNLIVNQDSVDIINKVINLDLVSTLVLGLAILFILYKTISVLWRVFKKKNEVMSEMDKYIDKRIDEKVQPLLKKVEKAHKRMDEFDKLELPVKLASIETRIQSLSDNLDKGFDRIDDTQRSIYDIISKKA